MESIDKFLADFSTNELDVYSPYQEGMDFKEFSDSIENSILESEIIYYRVAMDYLLENDASLSESLSLAEEHGYSPGDLNSEILATLLYQSNLSQEWYEIQDEIEEYFEEYEEFLENEEDEEDEDF